MKSVVQKQQPFKRNSLFNELRQKLFFPLYKFLFLWFSRVKAAELPLVFHGFLVFELCTWVYSSL